MSEFFGTDNITGEEFKALRFEATDGDGGSEQDGKAVTSGKSRKTKKNVTGDKNKTSEKSVTSDKNGKANDIVIYNSCRMVIPSIMVVIPEVGALSRYRKYKKQLTMRKAFQLYTVGKWFNLLDNEERKVENIQSVVLRDSLNELSPGKAKVTDREWTRAVELSIIRILSEVLRADNMAPNTFLEANDFLKVTKKLWKTGIATEILVASVLLGKAMREPGLAAARSLKSDMISYIAGQKELRKSGKATVADNNNSIRTMKTISNDVDDDIDDDITDEITGDIPEDIPEDIGEPLRYTEEETDELYDGCNGYLDSSISYVCESESYGTGYDSEEYE